MKFLFISIVLTLSWFIAQSIYFAIVGRAEKRRRENRAKKDRTLQKQLDREARAYIADVAGVQYPKKATIANGWYRRMKKH